METMKVKVSWTDVLQTVRGHRCKPSLLYPEKLSITIDEENKIFHDNDRFKTYLFTTPALQKVLEGKFQPEESLKNTGKRQPHTSKTQRKETHKHYCGK